MGPPRGGELVLLWLLLQTQHQVANIELTSPDPPALILAQILLVHIHAFKVNQPGLLFGIDVFLPCFFDSLLLVLPYAW